MTSRQTGQGWGEFDARLTPELRISEATAEILGVAALH